jgi:hypothetical protein
VGKTPTEQFYKIAYLLLLVIAIAPLWQGASGLNQATHS